MPTPKKSSASAQTPGAVSLRETRLPVTVAFDLAFRTGRGPEMRLTLWKEELSDLIKGAAKKFVGFENVESVRKALDIVLGLASLSLLVATRGENDPETWARLLVGTSLKDLVKQAIARTEQLHKNADGTPYAYTFDVDKPTASTKELLHAFALASHEGRWTGHEIYLQRSSRARQSQDADGLMRWLIAHLLGERRPITAKSPLIEDASTSDIVINALLFRHCTGLGFGKAPKKEILLHKDEFVAAYKAYKAAPAAWLKAGLARHDALVAEIPPELHSGLEAAHWFNHHLKKGPPAVTAKTNMDEAIDSISDTYYYDMFA